MNPEIPAAFKAAMPFNTPVMGGYLALGISCGLFTVVNGLPGWFAPLMSVVIFGGSLEFVTAVLLTGSFAPLETIVVAFMIQSRHLFYGIAMLPKFKGIRGLRKAYLIYALTDESFSVNHSVEPPAGIDRKWFMFAVSSLNQAAWIIGTTCGALIGPVLPFDTSGLWFVMTALFTVILVENMLKKGGTYYAVIGLFASVLCLAVFGSGSFLVPTLVVILILLLVSKRLNKGWVRRRS